MGRVGIGTDAPARPLHVFHPTIDLPIAAVSGDNISGVAIAGLNGSAAVRTKDDGRMTLNVGGDPLSIAAGGSIEAVTILPNGRVGIGTDAPTSQFQVSGNINISEDNTVCSATNLGDIKFSADQFQGCTSSG